MAEQKEWHVVSFSGGKDSTAMLLMMLEKGMRVDDIVFCDTGLEFPEMYEHIKKVEEYIGRKVTRLKSEYSFEYYLLHYKKKKGKHMDDLGKGFPFVKNRWCTGFLKHDVLDRYYKPLKKQGYKIVEYVGIAYDERERRGGGW